MDVTPFTLLNCSERNELHAARLFDCVYASIMTGMPWGGYLAFPLGRTDLEREALERADSVPDEQGAWIKDGVAAAHNRYGVSWRQTSVPFVETMSYYVVTGKGGFGTDVNHAIGVLVLDDTYGLVFNPLAGWNTPGVKTLLSVLRAWIARGPEPHNFAVVERNEFVMTYDDTYVAPLIADIVGKATAYDNANSQVVTVTPDKMPDETGVQIVTFQRRTRDNMLGAIVKTKTWQGWVGISHVVNIRPAAVLTAQLPLLATAANDRAALDKIAALINGIIAPIS